MEIKNRIIKTENVKWKSVKWLQNESLKDLTPERLEKLKTSLRENMFVMPFHVWQCGDELYFLDGHHRQKVLNLLIKDGLQIPDELPANYIECENREAAAKLVLVYSSIYANITEDGLTEFLKTNKLNINILENQIELPNINIGNLILNEIPEEQLDEIPLPPKIPISKLGDVFLLNGKHRVMCGDSTNKKNVGTIMGGGHD